MSTTREKSFNIVRATLDDVKTLAQISGLSFIHDTNTQLKEEAHGKGWFADSMVGVTEHFINRMQKPGTGRSKLTVLKAVDIATGQIVGHVTWGECGLEQDMGAKPDEDTHAPSQDDPESPGKEGKSSGAVAGSEEPAVQTTKESTTETATTPNPPTVAVAKIKELETLTSGHMNTWVEKMMPMGSKCMFICCIAVHPDFQGRGIGSGLVDWGTSKADRLGVLCWVHLSDPGWPVFKKLGWCMDDSLEVDLDKYATGPPPDTGVGKWGSYTFRGAVRQPKGTAIHRLPSPPARFAG